MDSSSSRCGLAVLTCSRISILLRKLYGEGQIRYQNVFRWKMNYILVLWIYSPIWINRNRIALLVLRFKIVSLMHAGTVCESFVYIWKFSFTSYMYSNCHYFPSILKILPVKYIYSINRRIFNSYIIHIYLNHYFVQDLFY